MDPELKPAPPRYLPYLDSARGIAALMVLFGHYTGWKFNTHPVIQATNFIFNAADAVSFFFVLSGMVLTYQYLVLDKKLDIPKYFVNRFLRLFPAFFFTVFVNALYWQRNDFTFHAIFNEIVLGHNGFWRESLLLRSTTKFYGPGWTLVVELAVSFFIPFLLVLARVNRKLLWWLILSGLLVSRIMEPFVVHFILGVALSAYYYTINSPDFKSTRWYRFRHLILLLAIGLFSIRRIQEVIPFGPDFYELGSYFQVNLFFYTGLASFVFLAFILRNKAVQRILMQPVLRFMGKISYGIYLTHWLIVCIIYDYWDFFLKFFPSVKVTFVVMGLVCFAVSTLLAYLIHITIELPFIKIGKRITARMKAGISV